MTAEVVASWDAIFRAIPAILICSGLLRCGRAGSVLGTASQCILSLLARIGLILPLGINFIWGYGWFDRLEALSWSPVSGLYLLALGVGLLADELLRTLLITRVFAGPRLGPAGVLVAAVVYGLRHLALPGPAFWILLLVDGVLLSTLRLRNLVNTTALVGGSFLLGFVDLGTGLFDGWFSHIP